LREYAENFSLAYMASIIAWITSSPESPRKAAPRMSPLSRSTRIFMNPFVSPFSYARLTFSICIMEIIAGLSLSRTSASVIPTRPSGGSVYKAYAVIRSVTRLRSLSRRFAVTISKSL
jgi:hypothetical protein